jgi:predicted RNase H-like HicB family nuclease
VAGDDRRCIKTSLFFAGTFDTVCSRYHPFSMDITVVLHDCALDGETGFAATCVEFPEANGQGETREECIANLKDAVKDVLQFRREEAERSLEKGDLLQVVAA